MLNYLSNLMRNIFLCEKDYAKGYTKIGKNVKFLNS